MNVRDDRFDTTTIVIALVIYHNFERMSIIDYCFQMFSYHFSFITIITCARIWTKFIRIEIIIEKDAFAHNLFSCEQRMLR